MVMIIRNLYIGIKVVSQFILLINFKMKLLNITTVKPSTLIQTLVAIITLASISPSIY